MDMVRIELAHVHEFLDLRDGDLAGRRAHRVEVHGRVPIDEVTEAVALPCLDDRVVADDRGLEHVQLPAELARFLLRRRLGDAASLRVLEREAPFAYRGP